MTIGAGIPLFSHKATFDPHSWTLTDHRVLDSGTAFLTYERAPGSAGDTAED